MGCRSRDRETFRLGHLLRQMLRAAEQECPPGHGPALAALGGLAAVKVPSRGVLWKPGDRDEAELHGAIERIAREHLGYSKPVKDFAERLDATAARTTPDERDALRESRLEIEAVSDTAHFYAGLAFAITVAERTGR